MKKLYLLLVCLYLGTVLNTAYSQTVVTFTLTQAPCNNNGILTANFTGLGLTPPLKVDWYVMGDPNAPITHNNVTTSTDALNNYSGAYVYVAVTDATNKQAGGSYTGAFPFSLKVQTTNAVCPSPGSATASITGGTSPFTYQWFDRQTNSAAGTGNPISLPAGQYYVIATDANGCTVNSLATFDSIWIHSTSNITYMLNTTQPNCTNGTATVSSVAGGQSPYSYLWSNSATTSSISGLIQGQYNVTVTDAQGCSTQKYFYLQQAISINPHVIKTPATCLQNDGALTSVPTGGTAPYSFLWSNSATASTQTGLPAGQYTLKVTDANGCFTNWTGYLNSTTPITATYSTTPSSCTTATGSAQLNISGGSSPYSVQWGVLPAQTGTSLTNVGVGNYPFSITDATGCTRTGTVSIPPISNFTLSTSGADAMCTQANGSATVSVQGGSSPFTYLWSNNATSASINNLSAGSYSVTVTDNAGCKKTAVRYVQRNSPVKIGLSSTNTSCKFTSTGVAVATAWGGTTPYSYSWSNGGTTPAINNLPTGWYMVNVTDANGCTEYARTFIDYNKNNNSCYCTITGTVFHDVNNNCVQDAGENGIPNILVRCSGQGSKLTDANGHYSFEVPTGTYTVSEVVLNLYPLAQCQNNNITVNATAGPNCVHTVNFANTVNPIHDMYVGNWNETCPVPGYPYRQKLVLKNMGTITESSVRASYFTDGQILTPSFVPSNMYAATSAKHYQITGSTLQLVPNAEAIFKVHYTLPTNIPLNTSLVFKDTTAYTSPISNWLSDNSPWNNVVNYTPKVVGSYDPNFKEVKPIGDGPDGKIYSQDSVLEYIVHFQNLGTYKAQNIYILDSLDNDLDWSTLRVIHKSHPCEVSVSENGVLRFQFDNIDLPAKMHDEEGSNGMVVYMIKMKKNSPIGTQFKNSASIYFDFNEPVITNTTINTLAEPQGVKTVISGANKVTLYPNPAKDVFTIRIDKGSFSNARVVNTYGQTCVQQSINNVETQINTSTLNTGIYFVIISGKDGTIVEKIEKL